MVILIISVLVIVGLTAFVIVKMRKEADRIEKRAKEQARIVQDKLEVPQVKSYYPDTYSRTRPVRQPTKLVERKTEESSYVVGESLADQEVITTPTDDFWGYNDSSSTDSCTSDNSTSYDSSPASSSCDSGGYSSYDSGSSSYDSGSSSSSSDSSW
jgi:hypothetical protein